MGLLDRFGSNLPGGGPTDPDGTALVLESNPVANHDRRGVRTGDEVVNNELWYLNMGKRPHHLRLEVRFAGADPYETEIRARVPVKYAPGPALSLPTGVELPVRRTGEGPADLEIDWKAFGARPDAKRETKRAAARSHNEAIREGLERTQPEIQAQARASNTGALPTWVAAVKAGKMKRKEFDQSVATLLTLGQIDEDAVAAAKAELDG